MLPHSWKIAAVIPDIRVHARQSKGKKGGNKCLSSLISKSKPFPEMFTGFLLLSSQPELCCTVTSGG